MLPEQRINNCNFANTGSKKDLHRLDFLHEKVNLNGADSF